MLLGSFLALKSLKRPPIDILVKKAGKDEASRLNDQALEPQCDGNESLAK